MAVSDGSGNALAINRYDEHGIPASTNLGRFQYTGQAWLPEQGLYYYKARMYSPTLGRFLQTDPIGYADGIKWYSYVHNDPVNGIDPSGTQDGCQGNSCPTTFSGGPNNGSGNGSYSSSITPIDDGHGGWGYYSSPYQGGPATWNSLSFNSGLDVDSFDISIQSGLSFSRNIWSSIKGFAHSAYCSLAPHPETILQASVTGSLARFGGGYAGGYTAAIDRTGSTELFQTDGLYRSLGAGAGLALTGGASTAKNVGDQAGPFLQGSATAAEVGGGTATVFAGNSPDGIVVGGEAGLDLGFQDSVMAGVSNSRPIAGVSCP